MFYGWSDVERIHVRDLLIKVRDLFADPNKWITYPRAENLAGKEVSPHSEEAIRWCLMGAGEKFASELFEKPLNDYVECAMRDYLDDITSHQSIHGMSYKDETSAIELGLEKLEKELRETK